MRKLVAFLCLILLTACIREVQWDSADPLVQGLISAIGTYVEEQGHLLKVWKSWYLITYPLWNIRDGLVLSPTNTMRKQIVGSCNTF